MDPTQWFQNTPYAGDRPPSMTPNMPMRPPGQAGPAPPMGKTPGFLGGIPGMGPTIAGAVGGQSGSSPYEQMLMQQMQRQNPGGLRGALMGGLRGAMGQPPNGQAAGGGGLMQQIQQAQQMRQQREMLARQYGGSPIQWGQMPPQGPQQGGSPAMRGAMQGAMQGAAGMAPGANIMQNAMPPRSPQG